MRMRMGMCVCVYKGGLHRMHVLICAIYINGCMCVGNQSDKVARFG